MKTPDEIKKGLETCIGKCTGNKPHCPYHTCGDGCMDSMNRDSLAYIQQLESRLAHVERERDAAVKRVRDLEHALLLMISQYCRESGDSATHLWMTAGETAFALLGLENYTPMANVEEMIERLEENPHDQP